MQVRECIGVPFAVFVYPLEDHLIGDPLPFTLCFEFVNIFEDLRFMTKEWKANHNWPWASGSLTTGSKPIYRSTPFSGETQT